MNRGIGGHHRGHRGDSDEWLTPPGLLAKLGAFDLDPCSPIDRPWDTAANHLTIRDNGLTAKWSGRVWCNPPYGPQCGKWLERLARHGHGTALVFARTETRMFHAWVWPFAKAMLFLSGRLNFHGPNGVRSERNAGGPSVLIAYGDIDAAALKDSGIPGKFVLL